MKKISIKELLEMQQMSAIERKEVVPTPAMMAKREDIIRSACHFSDHNMLGYCLYDPFRQEFTACHINREAMNLKGELLCQSPVSLGQLIHKLPAAQHHYLQAVEEQGYRAMMYHYENGIEGFRMVWVVRLHTNDGKLAAFVMEAQVTIADEDGRPWQLMVTLRRDSKMDQQSDEFYELFSILPHYEEVPLGLPLCMLRNKLTPQQFILLQLTVQGLKRHQIINHLHISKHTHKRHCEEIREALSINQLALVFPFLKN